MVAGKLSEMHFQWTGQTCRHGLGLLLFSCVVFGPLILLVAELGVSLWTGHADWLFLTIPAGRRFGLLLRSLGLATSVAACAMVFGILIGCLLWRWRSGAGIYLRWLTLILVAVPPYLHALTWMSVINAAGSLLQPSGLTGALMDGWLASWWVQLVALTPISVGMTLLGLESIEIDLVEAARMLCPDIKSLMTVIMPLAMPSILAGGGFVFLLSLTDYSVPSLFQLNVYSLEIFAEYSASNEPTRAFVLALPLLLITAIVVTFSQSPLRNAALKPSWRLKRWPAPPVWPLWFEFLQRFAAALLFAQILLLLGSLVLMVGSWSHMLDTARAALSEIIFTFWTALVAALSSVPLALAAAVNLLKSGRSGRFWWLLVTAPLAVPAPLVGIGLIAMWNRSSVPAVYGSGLMPVLVDLARFTPLAAIALVTQLRRIDPLLLDAARILQTNPVKTWTQIHLPMLAPGLLAAACITFVLSAGELGATLLVAPPGQATMTMRIYNYLHYGASETVAGLCLMMVAATLIAGLFAATALAGRSAVFPRNRPRRL